MKSKSLLVNPVLRRFVAITSAIVIISISSLFVYTSVENGNRNQAKKAFASQMSKVKEEIARETIRYQNLIATVGAFFNASQKVTPEGFEQFVRGMGTETSFPGVQGIAFAQRMEGSEQAELVAQSSALGVQFQVTPSVADGEQATLLYTAPMSDAFPIGMDTLLVPSGREGLVLASETGTAVASAPLEYVIDGKTTSGFVLAYPVSGGSPIQLSSNMNHKYSGWVFAFIDFTTIIPGIDSLKDLDLSITDTQTGDIVLKGNGPGAKDLASSFEFSVGSRDFNAVVTPTQDFLTHSYDAGKAARYAFLTANIQLVGILIFAVFFMHRIRRKREVTLTYHAGHDILTGLPNRYYLEQWLEQRVKSSLRRTQRVAVLFIDLDGFKAINDTLGHQLGDEFLIAISQRLQKEVRGNDVLARLGGDEFIVVLDEVGDETQAMRIAQRLIEVIRFPVMLDSGPVCVGASIGIAISQLDATSDSTSIIRFADAAMYAAKEDKDDRIRIFDHKLKSIVDGRHEVETSIRGATDRGEVVEMLQPLVNIEDGTTYGYEALCRWNHPIFGVLSPDQFLDAAKVTGEIIEIDRWMVNKAFENSIDISKTTNRDTRVWVNLSVRHLLQGEFYEYVTKALRNSETTADKLGVEIEEQVFQVDNGLLYPFLNQLRDLGIAIALDGFGSDASLQALKKYPYDVIKLDRAMVTDFTANPSTSIVPAVVELARSKEMTVVACGVETPEQLQAVIDVGCNVVQGYVFSAAKPIGELVDKIEGFTWPLPLGVQNKIKRTHSVAERSVTELSARKA